MINIFPVPSQTYHGFDDRSYLQNLCNFRTRSPESTWYVCKSFIEISLKYTFSSLKKTLKYYLPEIFYVMLDKKLTKTTIVTLFVSILRPFFKRSVSLIYQRKSWHGTHVDFYSSSLKFLNLNCLICHANCNQIHPSETWKTWKRMCHHNLHQTSEYHWVRSYWVSLNG